MSEFQTEHPHQVRWAMFYLGKHGFTESIPLLLKHLDYRYTASRLVTEDYPALKALVWLERPAVEAAVEAIPSEPDELRLELLCRLILAVEGEVQSEITFDELIDAERDATRRARLRRAIEQARQPYDGTRTSET